MILPHLKIPPASNFLVKLPKFSVFLPFFKIDVLFFYRALQSTDSQLRPAESRKEWQRNHGPCHGRRRAFGPFLLESDLPPDILLRQNNVSVMALSWPNQPDGLRTRQARASTSGREEGQCPAERTRRSSGVIARRAVARTAPRRAVKWRSTSFGLVAK
jgi:hypothetical protein